MLAMQSSAFDRLARVRDAMAQACLRASRAPESVRLLAVTKTRPDPDLWELYGLGLRAMGENRVAEALGKQNRLPPDIEWHMIGHLQSNKAKDCVGFHWLHSLDKLETAAALERAFSRAGKHLNVLLEANTGGEEAKDGVRSLDELARLAEGVAALPHLTIRGLMTMAPFSQDEGVVRPCFVRLRTWAEALSHQFPDQDWTTLSMGMTNDFPWAIEEGSTLVRLGTALFEGER